MRTVFDTNLVISGLLWSGSPQQVLRAAETAAVEALTSEALVDELREVLEREKFARYIERLKTSPAALVAAYLSYATVIQPVELPSDAVRDIEDVKVLEAAVGGKAICVVSGDDDLLSLKNYGDIVILNAREFLARVQLPGDS